MQGERERFDVTLSMFLAVSALVGLGACDKVLEVRQSAESEVPESSGRVVATVGQVTIREDDVAYAMREDELSVEDAMARLTEQALLYSSGADQGIRESAEAVRAADRLMVRAFLTDLEQENTPESIAEADVQAHYEKHRSSYDKPERRKSVHVLAQSDTNAARALAGKVIREMKRAKDPLTVFRRYKDSPPTDLGFAVTAEDLPAISIKDGFAQPFKDAVFGGAKTGVVAEPVQTKFGWHAIYVSEIQPARDSRTEELEQEIRRRLSQSNRFDRVAEIVRTLNTPELVTRHKESIDSWVENARQQQ